MRKKILPSFLAAAMVLSLLPMTAFASGEAAQTGDTNNLILWIVIVIAALVVIAVLIVVMVVSRKKNRD